MTEKINQFVAKLLRFNQSASTFVKYNATFIKTRVTDPRRPGYFANYLQPPAPHPLL